MIRDGDRRFWFFDKYVVFMGGDSYVDQVSTHLQKALGLWDSGAKIVMYSDKWGWFDPENAAFDRDAEDPEAAAAAEKWERETLRPYHAARWGNE
jgi:hypothetical protein